MIKSGRGGSIIFIASMSGFIVNWPQEQCAYNASKAAVIHLSKSLAAEWAKHGIRVNSISPGYMDTALNKVPALDAQKQVWTSRTPQQRLGRVDELNNLAVFMASDASSFMTGSNVVIDVSHSHLQTPCGDVLTRLSGGILGLLEALTPCSCHSGACVGFRCWWAVGNGGAQHLKVGHGRDCEDHSQPDPPLEVPRMPEAV